MSWCLSKDELPARVVPYSVAVSRILEGEEDEKQMENQGEKNMGIGQVSCVTGGQLN